MDRNLLIGGIVAAVLVAGVIGFLVMRGGGEAKVIAAPSYTVDPRSEQQPAAGQPGAPVPKMRDGRPLPM